MAVETQDLEASSTAWQAADISTKDPAPPPRSWSLRSLWIRYRDDVFWIGIYLLVNALVFWLRFRQYAKDPCVAYGPAVAKGSAEVVMFNCVLTLLSVCHRVVDRLRLWVASSPTEISSIAQRPLEVHREFHALTGSVVIAMSLVHSLAWASILHSCRTCGARDWHNSVLSTHTAKRLREEPSLLRLLVTLPMWTGLVMLICVVVLLPFSMGRVRRACFDTFASVHRLVLIPFITILLFHGAAQWTSRLQAPLWLVPALVIYAAERYRRLGPSTSSTIVCFDTTASPSAESKSPTASTIRIFLTKTKRFHRCFEPGMFVYLQVPGISSLEWHPFSVCSSRDDTLIELRVRIVGDWTYQFLSYLQATATATSGGDLVAHTLLPVSVPVYLDGPFGTPTVDYRRYESVAMVALGVGISPFLSVLRHQLHTWRRQLRFQQSGGFTTAFPSLSSPPLKLAWVVRDVALVEWFAETLVEFDDVITCMGPDALDLQTFVTAPRTSDSPFLFPGGLARVHWRRPDWPRLLDEWTAASATRPPHAIFISGSHDAARAVKHAVAKLPSLQRVDVYAERFY